MYSSFQMNMVSDEKRNYRWNDDSLYLVMDNGDCHLCITGTPAMWGKLIDEISAHLQDKQRQAHPEACDDGSELLAVIGDDTVTATQLREIMDDARRNAQRQGPMGERELCERIRTEGAVDAEEVARRAGF